MTFGEALAAIKRGLKVARAGWNGKDMHIAMHQPNEHDRMDCPFIFIHPVGGQDVPWVASQSDLLADDWELVD